MSTDAELWCVEHQARLDLERSIWSYLKEIQNMLAKRDEWLKLHDDFLKLTGSGLAHEMDYVGVERRVLMFFVEHRECEILIKDEYGRQHPSTAEPDPTPPTWLKQLDQIQSMLKRIEYERNKPDPDYLERVQDLVGRGVEALSVSDIRFLSGVTPQRYLLNEKWVSDIASWTGIDETVLRDQMRDVNGSGFDRYYYLLDGEWRTELKAIKGWQ